MAVFSSNELCLIKGAAMRKKISSIIPFIIYKVELAKACISTLKSMLGAGLHCQGAEPALC